MDRGLSALLGAAAASVAAGCAFDPPGFDGTSYACARVEPACPAGFECIDGRCLAAGEPGAAPDAGEAAPPTGADAAAPDAPPGAATVTFGERDDADVRGVTSDTTLHLLDPTVNVGGDAFLEIDADPIKVALLRFDLSAIPPGATVVGATLDVVVFDPIESGAFRLFPLTEAWSEDAATYVLREPGVPWTGPGATAPSADLTRLVAEVAPRDVAPVAIALDPAVVAGWIAAPATNQGVVWTSTSPDGRGGQLRSSEHEVAAERPLLRVTYLAP